MSERLILPRNCGNCHYFDGDCHCALPPGKGARLIRLILEPARVVCEKHEDAPR